MPIRATTLQQSEKFSQCLKPFDVFRAMTRMPHLDTIQTSRDETLESLASATLTGMCPDREPAGFMRNSDRVFDRELRLGDERRRSAAKISHERVAEILNDSARYEGAGHVWSAHRTAVRLLEYFVERNRDLQRIELLYDSLGANVTLRAQLAEPRLQGVEIRQVQRQQVDFMIVLKSAELGARNNAHSQSLARRAGRGNSIDCIVVS